VVKKFNSKSGFISRVRILILIFLLSPLYSNFFDPGENCIYSETGRTEIYFPLANGLKVYLWPNFNSPLSTIVLAVKAGTVEENQETNGYLHLLEHCLLFRQNHLLIEKQLFSTIRNTGMYYNAHTDQDIMSFEVCLEEKNLEEALTLLKDIVFSFELTEEALEKEKIVICQEIKEIERDPLKVGLTKIYSSIFSSSSYGLPVYGQEKVISQTTVSGLRDFYQKLFYPNNSALVIIGNFNPNKIKEVINRIYSDLKPGPVKVKPAFVPSGSAVKYSQLEMRMKIPKTYLLAGWLGPSYNQPDAVPLELLVEILGRGINPLLYGAFAGYPELVSSLSLHYLSHEKAGLIFLSAVTSENNVSTIKRLLQNFFLTLAEINYGLDDYPPGQQYLIIDFLQGGKNRIKWLAEKSLEEPILLGRALAKHLLIADESKSLNYLAAIGSQNSSDLRRVAREYLGKGKPVWLIIKPEK
jgi:predicted Zn-dependent peptidase